MLSEIPMTLVKYEVRDRVAEISLDHGPVNALTEPMLDQLLAGLRRARDDALIRAVIVRSDVPRRFCAGLDLAAAGRMASADLRALVEKLYVGIYDAQTQLGKPSIAAVNGTARGGGMTLAISCDLIVAGRSASFGYPEIDVGLIPAIHYAHLPRIVGRYRAFDLLFTGRAFDSAEAASLGLVSQVVDDDEVLPRARELAQELAAKPQEVLAMGRVAFRGENDRDYRAAVARAVDNFCAAAATEEAREGVSAFTEKRKPDWA
jgi:enoyl-CoA hydratase/carnithine racemase